LCSDRWVVYRQWPDPFARQLWWAQGSYGLWTFVEMDGVEPTHNHGERVLRFAVIWRRRSFGCHSAACCRYVERMLTVVQSLLLQKRNVFAYLSESIAAHRAGRPA
jgi:transposase